MLNKELEHSLNKAFHDANEKRHEFITVEHLLMMLADNDAALAVLEACGGDVSLIKKELEIFVSTLLAIKLCFYRAVCPLQMHLR